MRCCRYVVGQRGMKAERPHGRAKYAAEGCRCDICRAADSACRSHRRRQKAYGPPVYVDATVVREHVRELPGHLLDRLVSIDYSRKVIIEGV